MNCPSDNQERFVDEKYGDRMPLACEVLILTGYVFYQSQSSCLLPDSQSPYLCLSWQTSRLSSRVSHAHGPCTGHRIPSLFSFGLFRISLSRMSFRYPHVLLLVPYKENKSYSYSRILDVCLF